MRIIDLIRSKGDDVVTVEPELTVRGLLAVLAEHHIGAAVVTGPDNAIVGIVSERDIVRALASHGAAILSERRGTRPGDDRRPVPAHAGAGGRPSGGHRQYR